MKARVIDFETTGVPTDQVKAICEVGYTDVDLISGDISLPVEHLVNPGHPIPPVTQAVHHITDADVADAMSPTEACVLLTQGMERGLDCYVAHNAQFERQFFGGGETPWVCTMRVAMALLPDAPAHNNQTLRYWLKLDLDNRYAMPPHRAGPDTYVTAHILRELLKRTSIDEMVRMTSGPILLPIITFGKHKGKRWDQVPKDYLEWMINQGGFDGDKLHTARHYLEQMA
jgi:exodeoxyribonuclease X